MRSANSRQRLRATHGLDVARGEDPVRRVADGLVTRRCDIVGLRLLGHQVATWRSGRTPPTRPTCQPRCGTGCVRARAGWAGPCGWRPAAPRPSAGRRTTRGALRRAGTTASRPTASSLRARRPPARWPRRSRSLRSRACAGTCAQTARPGPPARPLPADRAGIAAGDRPLCWRWCARLGHVGVLLWRRARPVAARWYVRCQRASPAANRASMTSRFAMASSGGVGTGAPSRTAAAKPSASAAYGSFAGNSTSSTPGFTGGSPPA